MGTDFFQNLIAVFRSIINLNIFRKKRLSKLLITTIDEGNGSPVEMALILVFGTTLSALTDVNGFSSILLGNYTFESIQLLIIKEGYRNRELVIYPPFDTPHCIKMKKILKEVN